jgi:hypothetical protein
VNAHPAILLERAADLGRDELLRIAVARGCRHYAPLLPQAATTADAPEVPHELLGVLLLRGPADAATFQAIRCGAMVLSDLANSPKAIAHASWQHGVGHRVAHIARLGLLGDAENRAYWDALLRVLPSGLAHEEFLPGLSRLSVESRMAGPERGPVRTWLRTRYQR